MVTVRNEEGNGNGLYILIIDDCEASRSAMSHIITLKIPGAVARAVHDYEPDNFTLCQEKFDIVIADLKSVALRGIRIIGEIASHYKDR